MRKRGQVEELLEKLTAVNGSILSGPHKSLHGADFHSQCCRNEPHELRNFTCERRGNLSPQLDQLMRVELVLCKLLQTSQLGPVTPSLQIQHSASSEVATPEPASTAQGSGMCHKPRVKLPWSLHLPAPLQLRAAHARSCSQTPNVPLGRARHSHLTTEEGTLSLQPESLGNIRKKRVGGGAQGTSGRMREISNTDLNNW